MEPLLLSLFLISILSLFASLFFSCYKHISRKSNAPPGSHGWPIIGEHLIFFRNPEKFIKERMKKYHSRIFKTSVLAQPTIVFCGPQGNKFLFSNENKLLVTWWPNAIKRILPNSFILLTGDKANQTRKLLMRFLKLEDLQRYVGIMDAVAQSHLGSEWEGKNEVKAFPLIKKYNFYLACRILMGIEDPDHMIKFMAEFRALFKGMFGIPLNFPGMSFYGAMKAAKAIRRELQSVIEHRKVVLSTMTASRTLDLLSWLLVTADENGQFMPEKEILDNVPGYLIAGHDSSTSAIAMVMKYLAEEPHIYNEVLREQMDITKMKGPEELLDLEDIQKMKYSWNVVNEAMRLSPPAQGSFRVAITDFTYANYNIPKGSKLLWTPHTTHKNPECFTEPEKFNPSRFEEQGPAPYTFTPFGGGPRICPGREFAKLQILVFLHNVVKRFRWEMVSPKEKIVIEPIPIASEGLPLRLQPH